MANLESPVNLTGKDAGGPRGKFPLRVQTRCLLAVRKPHYPPALHFEQTPTYKRDTSLPYKVITMSLLRNSSNYYSLAIRTGSSAPAVSQCMCGSSFVRTTPFLTNVPQAAASLLHRCEKVFQRK